MIQARIAESEIMAGEIRGPLHGIPISLKDLIDVEGVPTTGSSRALRDHVAAQDSSLVSALREAGAVIIGKNTAYEFGLGLPMPGDWPPAARNPWDVDRIAGGSSSGSAAAVLAGLCAGSFGTDTGGSIRVPASYCGVVGLKPTAGLISTKGVLPLSQTFDHVGPLCRSVEDAAALMTVVAPGFSARIDHSIDGVRVGLPRQLVEQATLEEGIGEAFYAAVETLRGLGVAIREVDLPSVERTEAIFLTILEPEALVNHRPLLSESPELYGSNARQRLTDGARYSAVDYIEALAQRQEVRGDLDRVFKDVDLVVSPVSHQVAPTVAEFDRNPQERTIFTSVYNLVGAPAVSIPCGRWNEGMPVGLQLAGPVGADDLVLSAAAHFETAISWMDELASLPEATWCSPPER